MASRTAEVFYDLKGRRIHRRHSFSNYMLFSVDDREVDRRPQNRGRVYRISVGTHKARSVLILAPMVWRNLNTTAGAWLRTRGTDFTPQVS